MSTDSGTGVDTLLVGLDAACRPVLDRLFDAGATPTLAGFFEDAATGPLDSQLPPWTPSAWPTVYTGVNPGKHGVFGFLRFDGYDWDVVTAADVRELALWDLLGERGLESVVVNVPVTDPPRPFPGALVPGYVAPEDPECHPPGLLEDLRSAVPGYSVYPEETGDRAADLEGYRDCAASRADAASYLVDRVDPSFAFVQFQVCDTVFHQYPGDWDAVESVYGAIDDAFEQLLADCDPETVVVVSDHGIGEYGGAEFRVNEYLADHGYVRSTTAGKGMPSWASLSRADRGADPDGLETAAVKTAQRAVGAAARAGLTADRIYEALQWVGAAEVAAEHLPDDVVRAGTRRVDFADSVAYMRDRIELGVRLNLVDREPSGLVPPGEYEAMRSEVREALERARTPEGDPVFESVRRRESVYDGPYVDEAPDLITVPAGFDRLLVASLRGEQFGPAGDTWNHKPTGVFAGRGPGFDDEGVEGAGLLDVAPTVCATLDVAPSDRMDGGVVGGLSGPAAATYPEYDGRSGAPLDDDGVSERLADMGYLED